MWFYDQYEREPEKKRRLKHEMMKKLEEFMKNQKDLDPGISKIVDENFEDLLL